MKQLPNKIRDTLIEIGRDLAVGDPLVKGAIDEIRRYDSINRRGPKFWCEAVTGLSDTEIADLSRGLTYVEASSDWSGGSASGVIWLFQELIRRNVSLEMLDDLSSWILRNTKNPYNPFGTQISLGATCYSEYLALKSVRNEQFSQYLSANSQFEAAAQIEREIRLKRAAAGADARGTKLRAEIIETLNPLPVAEKLKRISEDPKYPPQFFPTSIADAATQEVVDALPQEVGIELARRLKGKRRGPWGKFRKKLYRSLGEIWNKKRWIV